MSKPEHVFTPPPEDGGIVAMVQHRDSVMIATQRTVYRMSEDDAGQVRIEALELIEGSRDAAG